MTPYGWGAWVLVVLAVAWVGWAVAHDLREDRQIRIELNDLRAEHAHLRAEHEATRNYLAQLASYVLKQETPSAGRHANTDEMQEQAA